MYTLCHQYVGCSVQEGFFVAFWYQIAPKKRIWLKNDRKMPQILDEIAKEISN